MPGDCADKREPSRLRQWLRLDATRRAISHDLDYRRLQFTIADLLAAMLIIALLLGVRAIPLLIVISMFAALYGVKYRILMFRVRPWIALSLYVATAAAVLQYLYFCVLDSWDSGDVDRWAKWVGMPIIVFTVPTAVFLYDNFCRPSLATYLVRSIVEIVVLIPLWACLWFYAMLILGWFGFPQPK